MRTYIYIYIKEKKNSDISRTQALKRLLINRAIEISINTSNHRWQLDLDLRRFTNYAWYIVRDVTTGSRPIGPRRPRDPPHPVADSGSVNREQPAVSACSGSSSSVSSQSPVRRCASYLHLDARTDKPCIWWNALRKTDRPSSPVLRSHVPVGRIARIPRHWTNSRRISMTMAVAVDDYYDGFRTFSWLADLVGLPIDQVRRRRPASRVGVAGHPADATVLRQFLGGNREDIDRREDRFVERSRVYAAPRNADRIREAISIFTDGFGNGPSSP